jgi:hypothetical protein
MTSGQHRHRQEDGSHSRARRVTQATAGSSVAVSIPQVNEMGAGPLTCDLDPTGNTMDATGRTKLAVNESGANRRGSIALRVTVPEYMQYTRGIVVLSIRLLCEHRRSNNNAPRHLLTMYVRFAAVMRITLADALQRSRQM